MIDEEVQLFIFVVLFQCLKTQKVSLGNSNVCCGCWITEQCSESSCLYSVALGRGRLSRWWKLLSGSNILVIYIYIGFPFFLPKDSSLAFSLWSPCLVLFLFQGRTSFLFKKKKFRVNAESKTTSKFGFAFLWHFLKYTEWLPLWSHS